MHSLYLLHTSTFKGLFFNLLYMRTNTHAEMKLHKGNIFRYYRQLHFHWTLIVLVHIKRHLGKTVYCRYLLCSLYNGKNRIFRNGRYVQFSFLSKPYMYIKSSFVLFIHHLTESHPHGEHKICVLP